MTVSQPPLVQATGELPPVSAVVPTHHRPELMRRAVQSILDQTYAGEIEVVVVFDDCPVELPAIPAAPGRSVRAVTNQRVPGLAGARNSGILAARHEFIAFLDDDDHWMPTKLAAQMAVFAAHPATGLVGTGMLVDDGRTTHERLAPQAVVSHDDLVRDRIPGLHSSSFVFRREVLVDHVGMIDEDLPGAQGEDYDVLLTTAELAPIQVVNRPLVSVRWSGGSYFYGRWGPYAEGHMYLLDKHPGLRSHHGALARLSSQIGFALAADGRRRQSRRWLRQSLRHRPLTLRAWLGLLVSYRLISATRIARLAHLTGRGI